MNIQKLLAFDFGMKRIGVAAGQTMTQTASPLTTLPAKDGIPDWSAIAKLIKTWQPDALIVGIPLNMDGSEQTLTARARDFSQALRERFQIMVYEADERLTTKAAREALFARGGYKNLQKNNIDQVAALLILEHWLAENH